MVQILLLPERIVDGSQRVTWTVRPERVAFLVHPTDGRLALAAIESACLTWGGIHHFFIPCPPGGRPDQLWAAILEKHDPDVILDLVGVDEDFVAEQEGHPTRRVERWDRPTETMEIVGAAVWAGLRRWKRSRSQGKSRAAINLHPLADNPLALPLAFRLGHFDPRPMDENMIIERSYRSGRFQDFLDQFATVDPARLGEDEWRRLATEVPLDISQLVSPTLTAGLTDYYGFPPLTKIGLPSREPSYWMTDVVNPEHEQHPEAFFSRIVVVGSPDSVEDLCLAWNLRARRPTLQFFPQWISPEWITDQNVLQSIYWGLRWESTGLSEERQRASLHLLSATLSAEELGALAPELGVPIERHERSTLDRFFTGHLMVGLRQTSVANFRRGQADVAVPDYSLLGDWQSWERIGWTAEIADYGPPRVGRHFIPWNGPTPVRLAADGLAGFINVPNVVPGDLWQFPTSSGWAMVTAAAEEAGYNATISDKGRRAVAVMQLLNGVSGLRVLASSRVYALLETMAEHIERRQAIQQAVRRRLDRLDLAALTEPQEAAFVEAVWSDVTVGAQFDRQHYSWDQVHRALGPGISRELCNRLLDWLIERRIVFQGYKFNCANCGMDRWYSINRLGDTQSCDGCGVTTAKPIKVDQLPWRYRLNEVIAQAVDQGVLPHLLAVNRVVAWLHDERAPLFGVLPGVQLAPRDPTQLQEIEVDLFAIKGGRIIVGECKRGGDRLTTQTVKRFATVSNQFNCSRIVYATARSFDEDAAALQHAQEVSSPAVVERWQGSDLLDSWGFGEASEPVPYLQRAIDIANVNM